MVSVIASSVRKGNVIEKEGKLYLVLTAENIHPGKGTPVTHLEMRRISDGVKTVERLRTTDRNSNPFMLGIPRSEMITSGSDCFKTVRASNPSTAHRTS